MLHSGCVKLHQKFRDFVGLPMGLLREKNPKNRMNTGLFGSRSGEYGLKAARRAPQFSKRWLSVLLANFSERFTTFLHDCVRKVGIVWSRGMQQIALELAEKAAHNKRICSRLPQRHKSYRRRCFPQGKHLLFFCLRKKPHQNIAQRLLQKRSKRGTI